MDPGLVNISVPTATTGFRGEATGMVLTPSGVVLTNNHVSQGATSVRATDVGNGRTYTASVVGYDRGGDVAVIQLHGASGLQTVPLGDSGGPLVNDAGQVIGMDVAASTSGSYVAQSTRARSFAIPINDALGVVKAVEHVGRRTVCDHSVDPDRPADRPPPRRHRTHRVDGPVRRLALNLSEARRRAAGLTTGGRPGAERPSAGAFPSARRQRPRPFLPVSRRVVANKRRHRQAVRPAATSDLRETP